MSFDNIYICIEILENDELNVKMICINICLSSILLNCFNKKYEICKFHLTIFFSFFSLQSILTFRIPYFELWVNVDYLLLCQTSQKCWFRNDIHSSALFLFLVKWTMHQRMPIFWWNIKWVYFCFFRGFSSSNWK